MCVSYFSPLSIFSVIFCFAKVSSAFPAYPLQISKNANNYQILNKEPSARAIHTSGVYAGVCMHDTCARARVCVRACMCLCVCVTQAIPDVAFPVDMHSSRHFKMTLFNKRMQSNRPGLNDRSNRCFANLYSNLLVFLELFLVVHSSV